MGRLSASEIYGTLSAAGYSPAAAVTQTAISLAETGGDVDAHAQGPTGSAVGALLIRADKRQTGTGGPRDIARLAGDPAAQAASAYAISGGGRDFSPWEAYRSGGYQQYLGQAAAAAGPVGATAAGYGPDWLPWNWSDAVGKQLGGARDLALLALVSAAGLALIGLGVAQAVAPAIARRVKTGVKLAAKVV